MRASRGQGGFTLIESVISVALVSLVILGLAAGMLTSVKSSASAKDTQLLDGALSAYAESFKGVYPESPTHPCPPPSDFQTAASPPVWFEAPDSRITAAVVIKSEGWDEAAGTWYDCQPSAAGTAVARLTVEVEATTSNGPASTTGQVVVRRSP